MSIRNKIIIIILILVIIPLSFVGFLVNNQFRQYSLATEIKSIVNILDKKIQFLDYFIQDFSSQVLLFANTPPIQGIIRSRNVGQDNFDPSTYEQWMVRFKTIAHAAADYKPYVFQIRLLNQFGKELVRVNRVAGRTIDVPEDQLQDKSDRYYFKAAKQLLKGQVYISTIDLNIENGEIEKPFRPNIRFATPIFDERDNSFQGVVIFNVNADGMLAQLKETKIGDGIVFDQDGFFITHPDPAKVFGKQLEHQYNYFLEQPELAVNVSKLNTKDHYDAQDHEFRIWKKYFYNPNDRSQFWVVLIRVPEDIVFLPAHKMQLIIFIFLFLTMAISSIIVWIFAVSITRPIEMLSDLSLSIAEGGLDHHIPQYLKEMDDEVGSLSTAFGQMTDKLISNNIYLEGEVKARIKELNRQRIAALNLMQDAREAEDRFRMIVEGVKDYAIYLVDPVGKIITWNQGAQRIKGYTAAEIIGQNLSTFFCEEDKKSGKPQRILEIATREGVYNGICLRIRKDGTSFWARVLITALRDKNGNLKGFSKITRDITEEKIRDEKILGLLRILDESPDYIGTADLNGNLLYHNRAARRLIGLPEDFDMSNLKISDMHPAWAAKLVLEKGVPEVNEKGSWQGETAILHRDGHEIQVSQVLFMVKNQEGQPAYLATIMRDITESKKTQDLLIKAMNARSEFTSMVSHELRTPLTVIKESVAIVYDETAGPINADQKDFLDTAKRNVDRLGRLINDVLDYQKLESQAMEFRFEYSDINEIVKEVGEGFRIPFNNKGLKLELSLEENLPLLNVDKDKLIQILTNLINNAMKFTAQGTVKLITKKDSSNTVKVSVWDQGVGIKSEDIDKLFKSFSQISTGMGRNTGGTGLGLTLSKKLVEQHGGKIGVESVYGQGSIFYFILPVEDRRKNS